MILHTNSAISHSQLLADLVESAVSTRSSLLGRATHAHIIRTLNAPHPSFLSNHLVIMYSKLDLPNSAQLLLRLSPSRSVVTCIALIAGFVHNGHFASAIRNFATMRRESIHPNDFTFPCVFKASGLLRSPVIGKQVHALAVKAGQMHDVFVGCSAFDMYCKTGLRDEARILFDEMPERNLATWNAYMSNAVLDRRPLNAVYKFIEFLRAGGEPNSITFCAFLNACSDTSALELGRQLHGFVMRCGFGKDVSVLNGLVDFYGKCRDIGSSILGHRRFLIELVSLIMSLGALWWLHMCKMMRRRRLVSYFCGLREKGLSRLILWFQVFKVLVQDSHGLNMVGQFMHLQ